jgi:phage terminase large subunit-like protein
MAFAGEQGHFGHPRLPAQQMQATQPASENSSACVRYWDLAATEKTELHDPDWTVGIKLGRDQRGGYWVLHLVRGRANPGDVEGILLNTATQDGKRVRIGFGQDPGHAGEGKS